MTFFKKILFLLLLARIPANAQIGNTAPDFTATDVHGHTHHLYEYLDAGKFVVLDFFFTTCVPCQYYSPQVNLAYEKYGCNTADVIFLSIDYNDPDAAVIAYEQQYNIEFPSIGGLTGGNGIVSDYGIFGFPTFYLIAPDKKIVAHIDPPTLQVFDYRFGQQGIEEADCSASGVVETGAVGTLRLWPNPAGDGFVRVEIPGNEVRTGRLDIFDFAGRLVESRVFQPGGFSVEGLPAGLYGVKFTADDGVAYVGRLVKM